MGLGRIGKTRARLGPLKSGAVAYRCLAIPEQEGIATGIMAHKVVGLILVAIIAVGYVVGWMRTSLFG